MGWNAGPTIAIAAGPGPWEYAAFAVLSGGVANAISFTPSTPYPPSWARIGFATGAVIVGGEVLTGRTFSIPGQQSNSVPFLTTIDYSWLTISYPSVLSMVTSIGVIFQAVNYTPAGTLQLWTLT